MTKYIFRLAVPYHEECQFVKRYKVAKPSTIVAISVSDSNKFIAYSQSQVDHDPEAQLSQLVAFIRLLTNIDRKQEIEAQKQYEAAQAEKARLANERAQRFLDRRKAPAKVDDSNLVKPV